MDAGLKEIITRITIDIDFRNNLGIKEYLLVKEFYDKNQYTLQWFSTSSGIIKRNKFIELVSEPEKYLLDPGKIQFSFISPARKLSSLKDSLYAEVKFTDAALHFLRSIAYTSDPMVKYNGLHYEPGCISVETLLQQALNSGDFKTAIMDAEPDNLQYQILRSTYQQLYARSRAGTFREIVVNDKTVSTNNKNLVNKLIQLGYLEATDTTRLQLLKALHKLQVSHNLLPQISINSFCLKVLNEPLKEKLEELRWNANRFKWLTCLQNRSYVLVNLASNRLTYFENNKAVLVSKIVVGKTSTPSPTLTSVINSVIYYPYWNVPYSIATNEMLPKLKRNSHDLDALKIEVLRGGYAYASSSEINWHGYSNGNFPFSFRQKPGCHNSLGLIKFDFENPFHVYLHDTNNKLVFLSGKRFFSHGCIRVEKPYELAVALGIRAEKINMDTCLTGMKPEIIPLTKPIPVFVIYATVDIIEGELRWFEDEYHKREN